MDAIGGSRPNGRGTSQKHEKTNPKMKRRPYRRSLGFGRRWRANWGEVKLSNSLNRTRGHCQLSGLSEFANGRDRGLRHISVIKNACGQLRGVTPEGLRNPCGTRLAECGSKQQTPLIYHAVGENANGFIAEQVSPNEPALTPVWAATESPQVSWQAGGILNPHRHEGTRPSQHDCEIHCVKQILASNQG